MQFIWGSNILVGVGKQALLTDVGANLVFALVTWHCVPTNTGKDLPIKPFSLAKPNTIIGGGIQSEK
jgi:hypothetical protein